MFLMGEIKLCNFVFLFVFCVGVGGNLAAIQASRISTYLHFWSIRGVLPDKMRQHWPNPCITFFSSGNIMYYKIAHLKVPQTIFNFSIFDEVNTLAFNKPLLDSNLLCLQGVNSRSARVLLMLVIPGHMVFLYAISLLQGEEAPISEAFIVCFLLAAMLQVNVFAVVA